MLMAPKAPYWPYSSWSKFLELRARLFQQNHTVYAVLCCYPSLQEGGTKATTLLRTIGSKFEVDDMIQMGFFSYTGRSQKHVLSFENNLGELSAIPTLQAIEELSIISLRKFERGGRGRVYKD